MIQTRSVGMSIFLSIITCGLYGIYWFICLTNEINELSGEYSPTGGVAFLLSIITCGIYTFIWSYNMGKRMHAAQLRAGVHTSDNSILYIILNIFGLVIVTYALLQSDINTMVGSDYAV